MKFYASFISCYFIIFSNRKLDQNGYITVRDVIISFNVKARLNIKILRIAQRRFIVTMSCTETSGPNIRARD